MPEDELAEQAEQGEPEQGRWSQEEQLLASVLDAIRRVEYVLICANTDKKAKRPDVPEPTRRPGAKPVRPKPKLTDEGAQTLFQLINGGAA